MLSSGYKGFSGDRSRLAGDRRPPFVCLVRTAPSGPLTTTYTTSWTAIRPSTNSLSVARSCATRPAYRKCSLPTTFVRRMVPNCLRFSAMAARRFSIKYQLRVEQDTIRMRLKKSTNLVRRLRNRLLPAFIGSSRALEDGEWAMAESVCFVNKVIHFFGKFNTQETGRLEIHGNRQPFNRHRLCRKLLVPVQDTLC